MSMILWTNHFCRSGLLAAALATLSTSTGLASCKSGASANNTTAFLLTHTNCAATVEGLESTAVGDLAVGVGLGSTAFGHNAWARGTHTTTIGWNAGGLPVPGATLIGAAAGTGGGGPYSTAIGAGTRRETAAHALGGYAIAIGGSDDLSKPGAQANGFRSIAVGQMSVTADFGTSVGFNTHTGFAATAVGTDASASGAGGSAFGRFAKASAKSALALGEAATANRPNSVALGCGAVANDPASVSVGSPKERRRIVNVAAGVANSDAATLGQVKRVASAAAVEALEGRIGQGRSSEALERELSELRSAVLALQQKVADLERRSAIAQVQ
jgi:hypothetical protein